MRGLVTPLRTASVLPGANGLRWPGNDGVDSPVSMLMPDALTADWPVDLRRPGGKRRNGTRLRRRVA